MRARRTEIERAAITRICSVSDPAEISDPEYADGLRAAVGAALDYGIGAVERSEERSLPIPTALLAQARLAARNRVSLDTVLRRYFAGYTLLGDYVIEEAERGSNSAGPFLKRLLRGQAALFDRLLSTVTEEYNREANRPASSEERHADRVRRLLTGELFEAPELEYDFDADHTGLIVTGAPATDEIYRLAADLDCRLLLVRPGENCVWAWLASRRGFDPDQLRRLVSSNWPADAQVAFGEPGRGREGWRFTHRQAKAALPIAQRGPPSCVRYGDIALLATIVQDDLLTASLRELYLLPLEADRDGGVQARRTLWEYFNAERNVSSAAAALGVSRQAVAKRLRGIEDKLGRPLGSCGIDLEAALRLRASNAAVPNNQQPSASVSHHMETVTGKRDRGVWLYRPTSHPGASIASGEEVSVKRIRTLGLAAVMALALTAVFSAAGASAAEFSAEKYPATVAGSGGAQTLSFSWGSVSCPTIGSQGSLSAQGNTLGAGLSDEPNCASSVWPESMVANGCQLIYRPGAQTSVNHYGGSFDISCPSGKSIQIGNAKSYCTVTIGSQSGLAATYENIGSGSTATVKATANATGIKYSQSGTHCSSGTFEGGSWSGNLTLQASNGGSQTGLRLTHKGTIAIGGTPPKLTAASYPVSLVGAQSAAQQFSLQYGKTNCEGAAFSSGPLSSTSELPVTAEYSGCTFAGFEATVSASGCQYLFNIENAGPPYTGKASISCEGANTIKIVATSAGKVKCTATIGSQSTNAGGLSFTNEASTVGLGFAVSGIAYHQQKGEGLGACTTGDYTTGTYAGSSVLTGYL